MAASPYCLRYAVYGANALFDSLVRRRGGEGGGGVRDVEVDELWLASRKGGDRIGDILNGIRGRSTGVRGRGEFGGS
jgi:hypothetical protein